MARLLHVTATPRGEGVSRTRALAGAFFDAYRAANPDDEIDEMDLFETPMPALDAAGVDALFGTASGADPADVAARRSELDAIAERVLAADGYVFTTPMWNFGVPYPLKHFFDIAIQPGRTFGFENGGARGLLGGRPARVLCTRAFFYGADTPNASKNHFEPWLETVLGFMGIEDLEVIALDGADLPGADERTAAAIEAARAAAARFRPGPVRV